MSRIDDSHQPYKRKRSLGPGPRRRPRITESKDWECIKGKNTKTHYVQKCVFIGDDRSGLHTGDRRTVKTKKKTKKKYNKLYKAWAKKHGVSGRKAVSSYSCRRQRGVTCK